MTDRELETRKRIERELPDGVQQDLVAIVVKLQLARRLAETDPAGAAALLDEIRADAQAALDATREFALRIYPPVLDGPGLRAVLRAASNEARIDVSLSADCSEGAVACAYLCCLELLPGASAISVREQEDAVVFEVVSEAPPDLGRVANRVKAHGGLLTTEPGRICATIPT